MSRLVRRSALRSLAVGIGPAICIGSLVGIRPPIRCDSSPLSTSAPFVQRQQPGSELSPDKIRQITSGSVYGFTTGLLVALFSRTFALLSGLVAMSLHIAARYGWNVTPLTNVLKRSSLWRKGRENPWFTASFAVTFTLAAFVHL